MGEGRIGSLATCGSGEHVQVQRVNGLMASALISCCWQWGAYNEKSDFKNVVNWKLRTVARRQSSDKETLQKFTNAKEVYLQRSCLIYTSSSLPASFHKKLQDFLLTKCGI